MATKRAKDYTKIADTRRVVFDVKVRGTNLTYTSCTGKRADHLLSTFGRENVTISARMVTR